jgi:hypothetical protein
MTEDAMARSLIFFSSKKNIAVKGSSPIDKLKSLKQRWEKVIEDCEKSSDQTKYRIQFCEAHRMPLVNLNKSIKNIETNEDSKSVIQSLIHKARFSLRQCEDYSGGSDALSFIILELEQCLSE